MLLTFLIFLLSFGAVLVLERHVHRRLQEVFLLITGHQETATQFYSFVLLPGVALHELSHAAMAVILGVRVRKFSLRPARQRGGTVRLGYVEVLRSDALRTSLIGAAPLFAGVIALIAIGLVVFNLGAMTAALSSEDAGNFAEQLLSILRAPDVWIWVYVVFAVANSMMPSSSDTQAWPPVIGFMALICAGLLIVGGTDLISALSPIALYLFRWLTAAFAITAFVDVIVIAVLYVLAKIIGAISGRSVEFK
jgi:hypothetical protein